MCVTCIGYRVAVIARKTLDINKAKDEEIVAIVENNTCGIDAIQVIVGCTFGKGNLIYKDLGKRVYTFGNRKTGGAIRIVIKKEVIERAPLFEELHYKISKYKATDGEKALFESIHQKRAQRIIDMAENDFCEVTKVNIEFPPFRKAYYNSAG